MTDESTCPACKEEFLAAEDEELCPECEDSMEEGLEKILLGKGDCAIVLREEGGQELYLPVPGNDDDPVSDTVLILTGIAISLETKKFCQEMAEVVLDMSDKLEKEDE